MGLVSAKLPQPERHRLGDCQFSPIWMLLAVCRDLRHGFDLYAWSGIWQIRKNKIRITIFFPPDIQSTDIWVIFASLLLLPIRIVHKIAILFGIDPESRCCCTFLTLFFQQASPFHPLSSLLQVHYVFAGLCRLFDYFRSFNFGGWRSPFFHREELAVRNGSSSLEVGEGRVLRSFYHWKSLVP